MFFVSSVSTFLLLKVWLPTFAEQWSLIKIFSWTTSLKTFGMVLPVGGVLILNALFQTTGQVLFFKGVAEGVRHPQNIFPLLSLTPLSIAGLNYFFGGSVPSSLSMAGMSIIVLATALLAYKAKKAPNYEDNTPRYKGMGYVVITTTLFWAVATIWDSSLVKVFGAVTFAVLKTGTRVCILLVVLPFIRPLATAKLVITQRKSFFKAGVFANFAVLAQNIGLLSMDAAVFSAVKRVQIIFSVLLAPKSQASNQKISLTDSGLIALSWLGVALAYLG